MADRAMRPCEQQLGMGSRILRWLLRVEFLCYQVACPAKSLSAQGKRRLERPPGACKNVRTYCLLSYTPFRGPVFRWVSRLLLFFWSEATPTKASFPLPRNSPEGGVWIRAPPEWWWLRCLFDVFFCFCYYFHLRGSLDVDATISVDLQSVDSATSQASGVPVCVVTTRLRRLLVGKGGQRGGIVSPSLRQSSVAGVVSHS